MPEEKVVKGASLNAILKFIKKKWGRDGVEEALKYAGIKKAPKDGEWFPAEKMNKVIEWVGEKKGPEKAREAGEFTVTNMGVFMYILVSKMSFDSIMKNADKKYRIMSNYGGIVTEKMGDKTYSITYIWGNLEHIQQVFC